MVDTATSPQKTVVVFAHSEQRGFLPHLARELKSRWDCRVMLIVNTAQDASHYAMQEAGTFDEILTSRSRLDSLLEPLADEFAIYEDARRLEAELNFRFTYLLLNDRHLGIGFSPGGLGYAESRWSRAATYAKALRSLSSQVEFSRRLLDQHDVALMINPPKACCVVAANAGVPYRYFTAVGYDDHHSWFVNEYMESNLLAAAFRAALPAGRKKLVDHYPIYQKTREDMLRRASSMRMAQNVAYEVLRYYYYCYKGYEKAKGMLPFGQAMAHFRIWSGFRELRSLSLKRLSDLAGKRFIYFPLSVEPEVTLTRDSPEFVHQEYAIHALAKELPAGVFLAVKEHIPAIGHRPLGYYRDISRIPNVVMLDPLERGLDAIQQSQFVATLNGTSGFEAVVNGVSSLVFGSHARYLAVPHAHEVASWHDIRGLVDRIIAERDDAVSKARRLEDGSRLLEAVAATSVDCAGIDFGRAFPESALSAIADLLEKTMEPAHRFESALT